MPLQAGSPQLLLPDLSEWQPHADMAAIRSANGGAAIIRGAYGDAHPDAAFPAFRAAASGYRWLGLYQYLRSGQDVSAQARAFVAIVGQLAAHEVPILDLEEGDGDQAERAGTWLATVDAGLGLGERPLSERSWLYSGLAFLQAHGLAPLFGSRRRTWIAAYSATEPVIGHTLWQCTNGKRGSHLTSWPGTGYCDTSLYHGTISQLAATTGRDGKDDDMLSGTLLADQATPIRVGEGRGAAQLLLSVADGAPAQKLTVSVRDDGGSYTQGVDVTWQDPGVVKFRHADKVKAVSVSRPSAAVSYVLF
jgi:hypothetical protein